MQLLRWVTYMIGLVIFSYGITIALKMQYLGVHPWDVLNVALYEKVGLSIGSWAIIISILLIFVTLILDKSYVKLGTFINAILVGAFVDLFLWIDFLPQASQTWTDYIVIIIGIVTMGFGGGLYNSAQIGAGPRDGFMLAIAEKLSKSVGLIRIIVESLMLLIGLVLGGPVFIFTFIFTFIQSPVFAFTFNRFKSVFNLIERKLQEKQYSKLSA
ncbi:YczE/YyaS/YitT family protein [Ornithinibacillus californiensis]|uniref:YczE/YyaS/YitT family protein n=1 Tax=Ornithinibacillus californiensis TaxID=161536 RepID=UPI001F3BA6F0|nr:YitT family protein [Ornithinibacillus californiensis]